MRIVFMGTPEFALPSLQRLLEHGYDIPAVVTAPDKPRGRGQRVSPTPVKAFALERHLPLLQPVLLTDPAFVRDMGALAPDLIVVVAFRILPREVYTLSRLGSFNLHASLLPCYRGAAPINWAIIRGESNTGVTTFFLQDKVDTGSILLQARVKIGEDETAGELHDKLAEVGGEIVLQTARLIELGKAEPRPQDNALASPAPKIVPEHCRIDWTRPAPEVHNQVRGLSPHPGAWTTHRDVHLKVYRTLRTEEAAQGTPGPGTIVHSRKENLVVATGNGCVSVAEVQQEGRKRMGVEEFLRGYPLAAGDRLGGPSG